MTTATEPATELVVLDPINRADIERAWALLHADAAELDRDIASPQEYAAVAAIEERASAFISAHKPAYDELCAASHRVWKLTTERRAARFDGAEKLKARARELLGAYKARQDQIRRDEERRIAEEQRRAELDRQRHEAKLLEKQGQPEMAAAVRAQPVDAPAVRLPDVVPDVGLSYREDHYWEPVGGDTPANRARALSMLIPNGYSQFCKFDDAALTRFAQRTKGTIRVPGIVFRSRQVPVRR